MRWCRQWLAIVSVALVAAGAAGLVVQPASAQAGTAADAPSPGHPFAYAVNSAAGTVTRVGLGFGAVGKPIKVGTNPVAIAINPNGTVAYVVNKGSNSVTPIYLPVGVTGTPLPVGHNPVAIAITPNGKTVFVVNSTDGTVTPINTVTNRVGGPITVATVSPAVFGIVISPDGKTGYVADATLGSLTSFDTTWGVTDSNIVVPAGAPTWLTFAPDGRVIYGATEWGPPQTPVLSAISVPSMEPGGGDGLIIGSHPTSIAITPNGQHVYTADSGSGTLSEYSHTDSIATIDLGGSPRGVAVSPDGKFVWVADASTGRLIRVSVATGLQTSSIPVSSELDALAIVPDQAPLAIFTVTPAPHGQPTAFDASASAVRFGTIAKYVWRFGDGTTATTTGPTTTHTYATARSYTATVTETDSAGTSTAIVFTGQTVSRYGSSAAVFSKTFTVG